MTTDRHNYLNYSSEHPMSLKKSIPYSQFLRLEGIYCEPQQLLEAQTHMYLFLLRVTLSLDFEIMGTNKCNTKEEIFTPKETTTPNFMEIINTGPT